MLPATDYTTHNPVSQGIQWLTDPQNWQGANGVPLRLLEHLGYSALTLLISLVIAIPIGLYVGHTGRGRVVVVSLAGMLRALPTLGLITLFALLSSLGLMPAVWALVLLAIPPLLTGVYAGISSVDRGIVDSARSMGMTELQILFKVEVPNGLKVMLGGFRGGVLQVVATVAVVAYLPLGGLGRYLIDGVSSNDYGQVFGGAVLIAVLAIAIDGLLALLTRFLVSPGLKITSKPAASVTVGEKPQALGTPAVGTQGGTS
ncbi:osmoprotectant transport system permease protein [Psychromicrobium silvestre]|uniref:Osmoprotectant transport system permease protein n=1 Tax=Psychromicrobium silvestre TaxID=1645614 RepID=A0A7Y9LT37_9MICC|nr:ABC transporter permease [Psychromicrobium silvestre]NYE95108.1 osmoprotectant transport system permease protein [Psychromicrobium silvestre]